VQVFLLLLVVLEDFLNARQEALDSLVGALEALMDKQTPTEIDSGLNQVFGRKVVLCVRTLVISAKT
jgi:hypothetical protein